MSGLPDQPPVEVPVESAPQRELPQAVEEALYKAIERAAQDSATAKDPREVSELGRGALAFAQALVILDPSVVSPQGVPPDALHPPLPDIPEQEQGQQ